MVEQFAALPAVGAGQFGTLHELVLGLEPFDRLGLGPPGFADGRNQGVRVDERVGGGGGLALLPAGGFGCLL